MDKIKDFKNKTACFIFDKSNSLSKKEDYFNIKGLEISKYRAELLGISSFNPLETVTELLLQAKNVLFISSNLEYENVIIDIEDICEDADITNLVYLKYTNEESLRKVENLEIDYIVVDIHSLSLKELENNILKYIKKNFTILYMK